MSLDASIARISELQSALAALTRPAGVAPAAAPAPGPAPAATPAGGSFQARLAQAVTASAPPAVAGAPPASAPTAASPGSYPHLAGDLDAKPELLARLERLAASRGERFTVTSGLRTLAEQQRLWDQRGSNPFPVARPGTSRHHRGEAVDVTIGGRPIQDVVSNAELQRAGLAPLPGDAVHVELPRS